MKNTGTINNMPKFKLSPKQNSILRRSLSGTTASNYNEALDGNISLIRSDIAKTIDATKANREYTYSSPNEPIAIPNMLAYLPIGLSNCTLTATLWVNPKQPLMRALTIIDNGKRYGYVEIPESHLLPSDLVIATNPNDNTHHTMLVSGFTNGQLQHTFHNKSYLLPPEHPLVTYSNGSTHPSGYRHAVGLMEYLDNNGKTDIKYYRHYDPLTNEVLLPEIVVTPKSNYIPKGQKIISIKR